MDSVSDWEEVADSLCDLERVAESDDDSECEELAELESDSDSEIERVLLSD